jgi:hypothetical protein
MVLFSRNKKRFAKTLCTYDAFFDYDFFAAPVAVNFKGK